MEVCYLHDSVAAKHAVKQQSSRKSAVLTLAMLMQVFLENRIGCRTRISSSPYFAMNRKSYYTSFCFDKPLVMANQGYRHDIYTLGLTVLSQKNR